MSGLIKNRSVSLNVAFILSSLVFFNILAFMIPAHKQRQAPTRVEFLVRTAQDPNEFISTWDTTKTGVSGNNEVYLPLYSGGTYNFIVDWGDENSDNIMIWNQPEVTHTYTSAGIYNITITGTIVGWRFNNGGDRLKILEISQWGCLRLGNLGAYFYGCSNLELTATDNLNLTETTILSYAFKECANLGNNGNMDGWDVSKVTSMSDMFSGASSFNQPISSWDVSSVKNMGYTFFGASSFNQSIGGWDVSSVTVMPLMFFGASSFNQPINNWNISGVTDTGGMFMGSSSFNQPIYSWDVSSVINMGYMFYSASSFNQPISSWDVSSVTDMSYMFCLASSFNQSIGNWEVSSVTNMIHMFNAASSFNQSIGNWDVLSVTDMSYMFSGASSFNQPLGNWNVSRVTDMSYMFSGITLSTPNYDDILLGWSQLILQTGVTFHVGYSKYSNAAKDARETIIANFAWIIIDGGLDPLPVAFTLSSNADTPDTDGSFMLTWTSSAGATNYSVYRYFDYITEINSSLFLLAEEITDLSLPLSEYSNGTYYFIVVAYNAYGETLSNCIIVVVGLLPEAFTLSSNADTPDTDGSFMLTWTSSAGATNYSVYRYFDYITEINGSLFLLAEEITDLSLLLSGYSNGTYYFVVVAYNTYGEFLSNCIIVVVGLAPEIFTLSSNADTPDTDGSFMLTWTSSDRATNYSVYRYFDYITEINGSLTLLAEEITDLSLPLSEYSDGTYYFIVVAYNTYGETLSNCIIVVVGLIPEVFTLSSNADTPDTDGSFMLTWTSSDRATNYSVYRYFDYITEINGSLILLAEEITDLSLPLSVYSNGTYYFIVVANNAYGKILSNCIIVVVGLTLGAFTLSSNAGTLDTDGSFTLTWTSSDGADNYSIYTASDYITEINGDVTKVDEGIEDLTYPITVSSNGDYYYVIVAYNEGGRMLSNSIYVKVLFPPSSFILSSNAADPELDGIFNLLWNTSTWVDNYSVYIHNSYISEVNSSITLLANDVTEGIYPIQGLPDGDYYFIVVAYNIAGNFKSNCLYIRVGKESSGGGNDLFWIFQALLVGIISAIGGIIVKIIYSKFVKKKPSS